MYVLDMQPQWHGTRGQRTCVAYPVPDSQLVSPELKHVYVRRYIISYSGRLLPCIHMTRFALQKRPRLFSYSQVLLACKIKKHVIIPTCLQLEILPAYLWLMP